MLMASIGLLLTAAAPQVSHAQDAGSDGPRLMRVSPSQTDGLVGRDVAIVLSFDRPMDLESIKEAAAFEPAIGFSVSGEAECLVVPANLLERGRQYTFRLDRGKAMDLKGRPFDRQVELTFSTRPDGMSLEVPGMAFRGDVVEGKTPDEVVGLLGMGVGQYPGSGRPASGNMVLMAHASGRIAFPFNDLQKLEAGDELKVYYGGVTFIYKLTETMVVPETATWILNPGDHAMLTVFVCCAADGRPSPTLHPPYRYVVRAALASAIP